MSPPTTRFCASCGAPAQAEHSHCARCGMILVSNPTLNTPSGAVRAAEREGRSKLPSLLLAAGGCTVGGFLFLVCGGIAAAVLIPNYMQRQTAAKTMGAEANLKAIWAAQQSWAAAHDGEFLEFYVDSEEPTDANLSRLRVNIGDLSTYAYEGRYDGADMFVITASGNVDEDESYDEWELVSDDPVPRHVYDDVKEIENYRSYAYDGDYEGGDYEDDDDDEYVEGGVEGGVVGEITVGGLGLKGVGESGSSIDTKSASAKANLEAIWKGQQAYKLTKKSYMSFDKGSAATWTALGVDLPEGEFHTFGATVKNGALTLTASANLDSDDFQDEWILSSADGVAVQVKNDALNLDLSALSGILQSLGAKELEK